MPSEHLWEVWGLILNMISLLLTILLGLLLCLGYGLLFFGGIQHSHVDVCSTASCNFGVLTGELPSTLPSCEGLHLARKLYRVLKILFSLHILKLTYIAI